MPASGGTILNNHRVLCHREVLSMKENSIPLMVLEGFYSLRFLDGTG